MAKEYLEVQKELKWMTKYCNELAEHLKQTKAHNQSERERQRPSSQQHTPIEQPDMQHSLEEFMRLENEKKSLLEIHRNLKEQLSKVHQEQLQEHQQQRQGGQPSDQSRSSPIRDDGWVVLSRKFSHNL